MRHFVSLVIMPMLFSWSVLAGNMENPGPSFDDVIFGSDLVSDFVPMGFGGSKVLEMIEDEKVRPTYLELRALGRIQISVKKIAAQNEHESNRNVYLFQAWQSVGFTERRLVASFEVESYINTRIMDHAPTEYDVKEIKMAETPNRLKRARN